MLQAAPQNKVSLKMTAAISSSITKLIIPSSQLLTPNRDQLITFLSILTTTLKKILLHKNSNRL